MPTTISSAHTYSPTNLTTPRSGVLLETITGSKLVKKFHAFYGTIRFTTAFIHNSPPTIPILSHIDPVHSFQDTLSLNCSGDYVEK
jgi:hypothetical protein